MHTQYGNAILNYKLLYLGKKKHQPGVPGSRQGLIVFGVFARTLLTREPETCRPKLRRPPMQPAYFPPNLNTFIRREGGRGGGEGPPFHSLSVFYFLLFFCGLGFYFSKTLQVRAPGFSPFSFPRARPSPIFLRIRTD